MKLFDFGCDDCEHTWELLVQEGEVIDACPVCGSVKVYQILGGHLTKLHDPQVRNAALKKRSEDHSRKHFKENVERALSKRKAAAN